MRDRMHATACHVTVYLEIATWYILHHVHTSLNISTGGRGGLSNIVHVVCSIYNYFNKVSIGWWHYHWFYKLYGKSNWTQSSQGHAISRRQTVSHSNKMLSWFPKVQPYWREVAWLWLIRRICDEGISSTLVPKSSSLASIIMMSWCHVKQSGSWCMEYTG